MLHFAGDALYNGIHYKLGVLVSSNTKTLGALLCRGSANDLRQFYGNDMGSRTKVSTKRA